VEAKTSTDALYLAIERTPKGRGVMGHIEAAALAEHAKRQASAELATEPARPRGRPEHIGDLLPRLPMGPTR
jgi:hypothetical protein